MLSLQPSQDPALWGCPRLLWPKGPFGFLQDGVWGFAPGRTEVGEQWGSQGAEEKVVSALHPAFPTQGIKAQIVPPLSQFHLSPGTNALEQLQSGHRGFCYPLKPASSSQLKPHPLQPWGQPHLPRRCGGGQPHLCGCSIRLRGDSRMEIGGASWGGPCIPVKQCWAELVTAPFLSLQSRGR